MHNLLNPATCRNLYSKSRLPLTLMTHCAPPVIPASALLCRQITVPLREAGHWSGARCTQNSI